MLYERLVTEIQIQREFWRKFHSAGRKGGKISGNRVSPLESRKEMVYNYTLVKEDSVFFE